MTRDTKTPRAFGGLVRHSVGLSDAHKELIKMLAAAAVADYLNESETADEPREEKAP